MEDGFPAAHSPPQLIFSGLYTLVPNLDSRPEAIRAELCTIACEVWIEVQLLVQQPHLPSPSFCEGMGTAAHNPDLVRCSQEDKAKLRKTGTASQRGR